MTRPKAFLLCPGRGSYTRSELGSLRGLADALGAEGEDLLGRLEDCRARSEPDLPSLEELDGHSSFKPGLHLKGRNASALIFACSILDARLRLREVDPILVGGNSLGFYTALVLAGALSLEDGARLVSTMARLQEEGPGGGQILWTLLDEDWNVLPERKALVEGLCGGPPGEGAPGGPSLSIRLGGHVVLAGDEAAMRRCEEELPKVRLGKRDFPFRLPFHGPFHTSLLRPVSERASRELGDLPFRTPRIPLIDGRGYVWPTYGVQGPALRDYTLGHQCVRCFDFTGMVRVALCDHAPESTILLAPGASLRAPLGHVESWLERLGRLPPLPEPHGSWDAESRGMEI